MRAVPAPTRTASHNPRKVPNTRLSTGPEMPAEKPSWVAEPSSDETMFARTQTGSAGCR